MRDLLQSLRRMIWTSWPSAIVGLIAGISIVLALDPAGSYPSQWEGPGLTVDEIFNVQQGVFLVESARALGWFNLIPGTSIEAFKPENGYNPDHPPLGRYWLGVHHQLAWWLAPPFEPGGPFVTACARTGSATAFALTVWLIGAFASCSFGITGEIPPASRSSQSAVGILTSLSLVLMPRVYGHAHLAALETITNLTCTASVLIIATGWGRSIPPTNRASAIAGVVMGLALLTKIQAVLFPIPIAAWAFCRWGKSAIRPLVLWGATAFAVFFLCWPYLWLDPTGHILEYLGRTTHRATIHCFYFGIRYDDKDVPWHYPFVMFAITVPLGLHAFGCLGLKTGGWWSRIASDRVWVDRLLVTCCLFPLCIFAIPNVAVYDGERLFLTVFPLWALFIGRGMAIVWAWGSRHLRPGLAIAAATLILAIQGGINLANHPTYLSYYNLTVGGLQGADRLGLEMNYWGDSVHRSFLQKVLSEQRNVSSVEILPSLHQFQNNDLISQCPQLRRQLAKVPDKLLDDPYRLRIAFRRRADLDDETFKKYSRSHEPGISNTLVEYYKRSEDQ